MQIKTHPPVTVLYSTHRTTIRQLNMFNSVVKELYEEAAANTFVSGPAYWIYHGFDGKPETVFTLEIAVPIQGAFTSRKFAIKTLDSFKAVTLRHEGAWERLPLSYGRVMRFVDDNKIPIKDESREVYLNVDFRYPENNIIEVQVSTF